MPPRISLSELYNLKEKKKIVLNIQLLIKLLKHVMLKLKIQLQLVV